ncbi:MAG: response regulator transcription factor, partial [Anaerolineales bacterium]|nr:response regulator transcription factor [Anaerolineales bacterium]
MPKTRILVVDDEKDLVWAVRQSLSDEDYEVLTAYDGVEALAVAQRHRPDLIILDIIMPQLDGLQVCRKLRRDLSLAAVPILFLTVRSAIEDRIKGLDEGGDDYLVKPFDLGELKARVRALLRRARSAPEEVPATADRRPLLVVDPLALDLYTSQVYMGEKTMQLTPTEFDLLHHLMTHAGEVFSSQQLLQQVWGYPPRTGDPGTVRWHVKQGLCTNIELYQSRIFAAT